MGTAGLSEDGQQMQQLADACLVIDALDPSAKEELIRNVCSKELTAYQQIFQGTGKFALTFTENATIASARFFLVMRTELLFDIEGY